MKPYTLLLSILPGDLDLNWSEGPAPTDTDYELYEAMIASRLPDEVTWSGDELLCPADSDLTMYEFRETWNEIRQDAYEELCSLGTNEAYRAAAAKYGVDVPDDLDIEEE